MSKTYVVQWKSRINGRAGKGTKQFTLEEAQTLVRELNQEYPNIHHEVVDAETAGVPVPEPEIARQTEPVPESSVEKQPASPTATEHEDDKNPYETHVFSQ